MAEELSEDQATGRLAEIYHEVRSLWAVPYVSSIHRLLATQPGFLEWAWDTVAPVFRNGQAQEAGWRAADGLEIPSLTTINPEDLVRWQIDENALAEIRHLSAGFVRVAPVNMVFAGLIKRLLEDSGSATGTTLAQSSWRPPPPLPQPPVMVAMPNDDASLQQLLERFGTEMGGGSFVPGLYRMIGHWPRLLAHLAFTLRPRLDDPQALAAYDALRTRIDGAAGFVIDEIAAELDR